MRNLKMKSLIFNALVIFALGALLMGPSLALAGVSLAVGAATGTALSFMPKGMAFMAIQVEIWQNHIEEELFKDNSFLRLSHSADANVIDSKIVHIPQSGGSGNVVKNRAVLPAAIRVRQDTDVIYLLDEYTTDPVRIPDADTHELSYDKRNSVLGEDMDKLKEVVAEETIINWLSSPASLGYGAQVLPASRILETTGPNVAASAEGATGQRKGASRNDLQRMQTMFRTQKRWFNGKMNALLTPEMEAQMFPVNDIITATYMQNVTEEERRMGLIYKVHGWNIWSRSTVARLNAAGDILAPGSAGTTTDDEASLFWYTEAVEFAMGGARAFQDLSNPVYYSDIYSFLVRAGGRARRADYGGIALLKQAKTV
jgi:hypothetical protein